MPVLRRDRKKIYKPQKTPETPVGYRKMKVVKKSKRRRKAPKLIGFLN